MCFAKCVSTRNQRDGLFIIHRHPTERLANVVAAASGSGLPFGPSGLT